MLSYLSTPYLLKVMSGEDYGQYSTVYAAVPFLNVLFVYGLETAFFRYAQKHPNQKELYNTLTVSMLASTLGLGALLYSCAQPIAHLLRVDAHPEWIRWMVIIVAIDALAILP